MFANLRLVATDKFMEYRGITELFIRLGNEGFAAAMQAGIRDAKPSNYSRRSPWLLYHSWRQDRIQIDDRGAALVRDLMAGVPTGPEHEPLAAKLREIGWADDDQPVDLDELVKRTSDPFLAIQNEIELRAFLARVQALRPKVVVEIGTARGGMLFCFSQLATRDATLVSIDLPGAINCGGQTPVEREVFATFGPVTQQIHFIPEDSHLPATRQQLVEILAGQPIDLLFIDGDHSYEGCLADFAMYQPLVSADGLIVLHDICLFPDAWPGTGVGPAWQELKARYGGEEIIDATGTSTPPLQPDQHWRWGIGVIEARRVR
jgi:predicted O-methyltransferase YrrM